MLVLLARYLPDFGLLMKNKHKGKIISDFEMPGDFQTTLHVGAESTQTFLFLNNEK